MTRLLQEFLEKDGIWVPRLGFLPRGVQYDPCIPDEVDKAAKCHQCCSICETLAPLLSDTKTPLGNATFKQLAAKQVKAIAWIVMQVNINQIME